MRITNFLVARSFERKRIPGKGYAYSAHTIISSMTFPKGQTDPVAFPALVEVEGDRGRHGVPIEMRVEVIDPTGLIREVDWTGIMGTAAHPKARPRLLIFITFKIADPTAGVYRFRFICDDRHIGTRTFTLLEGDALPEAWGEHMPEQEQ